MHVRVDVSARVCATRAIPLTAWVTRALATLLLPTLPDAQLQLSISCRCPLCSCVAFLEALCSP